MNALEKLFKNGQPVVTKKKSVVSQTALFVNDITADYGVMEKFLGFSPSIHVEKGALEVRIKGAGKTRAPFVISKEGDTIQTLTPAAFAERFEIVDSLTNTADDNATDQEFNEVDNN